MESLEEYGLTGKESMIYTILLEYEELNASQIAKYTKINRSVVYSHLESLIDKGLVSYFVKNNVKYFKAANPESLIQYLKEKQEKLQSIIPRLKEVKKNKQEEVKVELYRGTEGWITILKDIIRHKEEVFILGYQGEPEEILPAYTQQYIKQINKEKIREKILSVRGAKISIGRYSEVKYLPREFEIPSTTVIYGDKIVIAIYTKPYFAIVVKSRDVAESYKRFFELLWKLCRKN